MKILNRNALTLLFGLTYFVSYLTRINYGAVISEMESATGFSKQLLSMALTGSFITYGIGQILSGFLGDKIPPKKLVLIGLLITTAMNLTLPFCNSPWLMTAVWSINGLAQAFMWPPIVKLLVALFSKARYSKSVVRVSWGSTFGTIIVYLLSPVVIKFFSWKGVFFFSAFFGIAMIILWQSFCPNISPQKKTYHTATTSETKVFTPILFIVGLAIIICGMLRDGVATWTPSLISESFNLSNASGILSGTVLPIFSMICYEIALTLYRKRFTNPIVCGGILFLISALSSVVLNLSLYKSAILSVISISLLNGAMHGVSLMLTSMLPAFYAASGKVSTISGILNSFIYIGSAVSTYGIALLTEHFNWNITIIIWLVLSLLGITICFGTATPWKNIISKQIKTEADC